MNYEEVLEFMFNSLPMYQRIGKAAYKADLENTLALDKYFNSPHCSFKSIHVAGTNGKGSVSHSIASILQEAGYKTGLYTSPHLIDFRERIKIDGNKISKDFICDFINTNNNIIKELTPSFFEMSVALAFQYFKFSMVDIAVIEVGMGGRLDSTNIINPLLSIITNIGYDHTQFLGDTLEKIALEKAGIIKFDTPILIGETQKETKKIFNEIANKSNAPIYFADDVIKVKEIDEKKGLFCIKENGSEYKLSFDLTGKYQEKNLATILEAIKILINKDLKIKESNIKQGLSNVKKNTGLRGRWEILNNKPLIICDTGHNKEGLSYVIPQILSQNYERLHIILGFVNDKNIADVLKLFPKNAKYYFTQANIPRAMASEILAKEAEKYDLYGDVYLSVEDAYKEALTRSSPEDMIFIGGSTFVVGDLLASLEDNL